MLTLEQSEHDLRGMQCSGELINFARALDDSIGGLDWPHFLGKPWKWAGEYRVWVDHGKPLDGDGAAWDRFAESVQALA